MLTKIKNFTNIEALKRMRGYSLALSAKSGPSSIRVSILLVMFDPALQALRGKISIDVAGKEYGTKSFRRRSKLPFSLRLLSADIQYDQLSNNDIHNLVSIKYSSFNNSDIYKPVHYLLFPKIRGVGHSKSLYINEKEDTTIYFRQSLKNIAFITVRRTVASDHRRIKSRINLAYYLAPFFFWKKVILLYEKESGKYEESAAALYERLLDLGYKNAYYILDRDSAHNNFVPEKYKGNIVAKYSLRHFIYFFIAKTFLGTEVPAHCIDLRTANKHVIRRIKRERYNYVFLQHGVMYMVSLGSATRRAFRKGKGAYPDRAKIIVSSEAEANHFVEYGNYDKSDLYITGLPKFDKNKLDKKPDKIVVMPTWRPWEYNQIRANPTKSKYYQMLKDIIAAVPEELKDKIELLPHPLFVRELSNSDLKQYIHDIKSYDDVLEHTALLITDYSSIAYDSFYRGSNVIFWWKDKDACMEQYEGWLMLNEKNVFGDVVNDKDELKKAIDDNYQKAQKSTYKNRYKKLVEFSDGKNTDRTIEFLLMDGLI